VGSFGVACAGRVVATANYFDLGFRSIEFPRAAEDRSADPALFFSELFG